MDIQDFTARDISEASHALPTYKSLYTSVYGRNPLLEEELKGFLLALGPPPSSGLSPDASPAFFPLPGKPKAYDLGLLCLNHGPFWRIAALNLGNLALQVVLTGHA